MLPAAAAAACATAATGCAEVTRHVGTAPTAGPLPYTVDNVKTLNCYYARSAVDDLKRRSYWRLEVQPGRPLIALVHYLHAEGKAGSGQPRGYAYPSTASWEGGYSYDYDEPPPPYAWPQVPLPPPLPWQVQQAAAAAAAAAAALGGTPAAPLPPDLGRLHSWVQAVAAAPFLAATPPLPGGAPWPGGASSSALPPPLGSCSGPLPTPQQSPRPLASAAPSDASQSSNLEQLRLLSLLSTLSSPSMPPALAPGDSSELTRQASGSRAAAAAAAALLLPDLPLHTRPQLLPRLPNSQLSRSTSCLAQRLLLPRPPAAAAALLRGRRPRRRRRRCRRPSTWSPPPAGSPRSCWRCSRPAPSSWRHCSRAWLRPRLSPRCSLRRRTSPRPPQLLPAAVAARHPMQWHVRFRCSLHHRRMNRQQRCCWVPSASTWPAIRCLQQQITATHAPSFQPFH